MELEFNTRLGSRTHMHKIAAILPPEDTAGADQCYCAEENAYGFSVASMYNAKLLMK
jgi:hypothetical protein